MERILLLTTFIFRPFVGLDQLGKLLSFIRAGVEFQTKSHFFYLVNDFAPNS